MQKATLLAARGVALLAVALALWARSRRRERVAGVVLFCWENTFGGGSVGEYVMRVTASFSTLCSARAWKVAVCTYGYRRPVEAQLRRMGFAMQVYSPQSCGGADGFDMGDRKAALIARASRDHGGARVILVDSSITDVRATVRRTGRSSAVYTADPLNCWNVRALLDIVMRCMNDNEA